MSKKFEPKKINNLEVKVLKGSKEIKDERPVRGKEMFALAYCNIALIAKKMSGKTQVIGKILQECAGPNTQVIAFVATINKDTAWANIKEMLHKKNISFDGYDSIYDTETNPKKKLNRLADLVKMLQANAAPKEENDETQEGGSFFPMASKDLINKMMGSGKEEKEDEEEETKVIKDKFISPEYILIFDDLATEIKDQSVINLLKMHRHLKMKVIISTQWVHDILPSGLKQIDYWILFKGQSEDKLEKVYKDASLTGSIEDFKWLYADATKEKYSFLYIDTRNNTFRKTFMFQY